MISKTWSMKLLSLVLVAAILVSISSSAFATGYDEGCVELPEDVEYVEETIDYDESYDGFSDDYYADYGFSDGEDASSITVPTYSTADPLELADAYIKYCEHPTLKDEHGDVSFAEFAQMHESSGSDSPAALLDSYLVDEMPSDWGSSSVARSGSGDWYYNTGESLPEQAVYGNNNLLSLVRKGDLIYESSGTVAATIVGHIAIVEGVFWDSEQERFYIRLIEAVGDGVCRGILDETRMSEKNSKVLRVRNATNLQKHIAVEFFIDQLGKPYNVTHVPPHASGDSASWYCSELAWAAYKYAGINLIPIVGIYVTPANLFNTYKTKLMKVSNTMPSSLIADNNVSWAAASITYLVDNGIFTGTTENTFSPNNTLTRAMLVTVLYRLEGCPSYGSDAGYSDVTNMSLYYYDAVCWATENGIVTGYDDGKFKPNVMVTREQIATILYRYAECKDLNCDYEMDALDGFADASIVSSYALEPMQWAVSNGILTGSSATTLSPRSAAERCQAAVLIHRFITNMMVA